MEEQEEANGKRRSWKRWKSRRKRTEIGGGLGRGGRLGGSERKQEEELEE